MILGYSPKRRSQKSLPTGRKSPSNQWIPLALNRILGRMFRGDSFATTICECFSRVESTLLQAVSLLLKRWWIDGFFLCTHSILENVVQSQISLLPTRLIGIDKVTVCSPHRCR